MDKAAFLELDFSQVSHPGAAIFLAWLCRFPIETNNPAKSLDELTQTCENWLISDNEPLRKKALEALLADNTDRFEKLAIEYLLREEFAIYDHFSSPSEQFKLRWVAVSFAHKYFSEMLPNKNKKSNGKGAPRLDRNIDLRRHGFVKNVQSTFMSWAYEIYLTEAVVWPARVNLNGGDLRPIFISFENKDQLNNLYRNLRETIKIRIFRNLQEYFESKHKGYETSDLSETWSILNKEIGLFDNGRRVDEGTISKSLSIGKGFAKTDQPAERAIDVSMKWETDEDFLSQNFLK